VLPVAVVITEAMFGEPYAKELHKITLECNTVGTVVPDISEGFYDQLTDQF
jgi:hypothetical protein